MNDVTLICLGIFALGTISVGSCVHLSFKLDEVARRFDEHGHNTSTYGGTKNSPVEQKDVDFEQLIAAIRDIQKNNALDAKTLKELIDAANESKSRSG